MGALSDIDHFFGGDLAVTATGDLALVSGSDRTIQRVIRRLLTNATTSSGSDYPWEPGYGAGLGQKIGDDLSIVAVKALVIGQLRQEASVASLPAPQITVTPLETGNGATISVFYWDNSGVPQNFSFDLGP